MQTWQRLLMLGVKANEPTLVWGDPGIGKTVISYAIAEAGELPCEVVIASLRDPSDFLGLPVVDGKEVNMAPPGWAKRLTEHGKGLLILDEITTAAPAVQAALLRVVLEKVVGDQPLPKEVRVIALANDAEQAGGWELSAPLVNRFFHIKASKLPVAEWVAGLIDGWPRPDFRTLAESTNQSQNEARALVAGFLTARPELLHVLPKGERRDEGWASPRSWHMAQRLLAFALPNHYEKDMVAQLVGGCVGPGTGLEFATWSSKLDLPNPYELLDNPSKFKPPVRADLALVILNSVVTAALEKLEGPDAPQVWLAAWTIIAATAKTGKPDVCWPPGRRLVHYNKKGTLPLPEAQFKSVPEFVELIRLAYKENA